MSSRHRAAGRSHRSRQVAPDSGNSPTMTIDNDSYSSTRPHIMGYPGTRVVPVQAYAQPNLSMVRPGITQLANSGANSGATTPLPQLQPQPQSTISRQINDSHFNISSDHRLHEKLVLVDTPDASSAQSLVGRLAVVRPSSDNVIVVEAKKPTQNGGTQRSVEAIYQVIGNSLSDSMATASIGRARRVHQAELGNSRSHVGSLHVDIASPAMHNQRLIAIPKSRVSSLRPAHRQLPSSRTVAEGGPVYTRRGSLAAHRPSTLMLLEEKEQVESTGSSGIVLTDSYYDDPGYDLVNEEIDSLFCQSFDMDMLPEAPERKISHYNIGVKDVPRRSPTPSLKEEDGEQMVHHTLGVVSHATQFAKPVIREQDVDFYIRMLTLRAKANHADETSMPQPPQPRHVDFSEDSLDTVSEQDESEIESVIHIPPAEAPRELQSNLSHFKAQVEDTSGSNSESNGDNDSKGNVLSSGRFSNSRNESIGRERLPALVVDDRAGRILHDDASSSCCDLQANCTPCIFPQTIAHSSRPKSAPAEPSSIGDSTKATTATAARQPQQKSKPKQNHKQPQRGPASEKSRRRSFTAAVADFVFRPDSSDKSQKGQRLASSRSTGIGTSSNDSGYVTANTRPHLPRSTNTQQGNSQSRIQDHHSVVRISSSRSVRPMPEIDELRRRSQMESSRDMNNNQPTTEPKYNEKSAQRQHIPVSRDECSYCDCNNSCSGCCTGCCIGKFSLCFVSCNGCSGHCTGLSCNSSSERSRRRDISCWPSWAYAGLRSTRRAAGTRIEDPSARQQQQEPQHRQQHSRRAHAIFSEPTSPSGAMHSVTSSWGHIFHTHQRPASSRRTTRVRDVLMYPFRLSYNCLLWWMAPCITR